ncbi:MAG TPA: ABC transporter permease [Geminicoccus sp.]|jgi:spermidine/putrescine transport system permease protein|uniref:ABC transporter permease n=1 Tax=Geminicoccus sp. TaxID=2024832 RepID=UPI002E36F3AC|nr:ABC transporter permease [Geminicoccus sp.]HEX2526482.1 ABC transporter permease [Geminicoccus sp.]
MRIYAVLAFLFLYGPIVQIVIFSFTTSRSALTFACCSTEWYGKALGNPFVLNALGTSLFVALVSAMLATLAGTAAALGLERVKGTSRLLLDGLLYAALTVPGIVIGIATLIALVALFDLANPLLVAWWPAEPPPRLSLGKGSLILAHGLFGMALVVTIIRARLATMDRTLVDASNDLYASPTATFRQVTLPLLAPAILASFLLSFTFSFDDFIVAFFVAASDTTLPMYVFGSIRRGITPEINAIGTLVLFISLMLMILAQSILRLRSRPARSSG